MRRSDSTVQNVQDPVSSRDYSHLYKTRDFFKGKSFDFDYEWAEGLHYFNDEYVVDFVTYLGSIYACKKTNHASADNAPGTPGGEEFWALSVHKGDKGDRSTIQVGTVTKVPYDEPADVRNVGTENDAIFDFDIPQGDPGDEFVWIGCDVPDATTKIWYDPCDSEYYEYAGASAYELAVKNGFVGTEEEWLLSLIGPQGPIGPTGPEGQTGNGIESVDLDDNDNIIITYTDGTTHNAGSLAHYIRNSSNDGNVSITAPEVSLNSTNGHITITDTDIKIETDLLTYNGYEVATLQDLPIDNTRIIWVNGSYIGAEQNGTVSNPYNTIQGAIDNSTFGSEILIAPGTYNEDVNFVGKRNISIAPAIVIANQSRVEISGGLNIDADSLRIGVQGMIFEGPSTIDSSNGNIYLEAVNFNGAITFEGDGYVSARTCWFNGLTWTDGNIELNGCYNENLSTWALNAPRGSGLIFAARNCLYPIFNHTGGIVIGVDNYYGVDSLNNSIFSNSSDTNDALLLTGGSLQQPTGTYGYITKTGVCPYSLGVLALGNDASLTLTGTRIDSGLGGSQVFVYQSTPGYTRNTAALRDHLVGISNKFIELSSIALSDQILTRDTAGWKANLSVVADGNHVQVLGKNDTNGNPIVIGEFNVLQSQIIDDVRIENGILYITFIVDGDPGTETVEIDLDQFIDVYLSGDYINVADDNTINLKYDELHDQLINDGFLTDHIEVIDNLTSTDGEAALSANQGRTLNAKFDNYLPLAGGTMSGTLTSQNLFPSRNETHYLGNDGTKWLSTYSRNIYSNHIVPFQPNTGNVGSVSLPWETGYFNNLYQGGVKVATLNDIVSSEEDPIFTAWKNGTSIVLGSDNQGIGLYAISIGFMSGAGDESVAIGHNAQVTSGGSVGLGTSSLVHTEDILSSDSASYGVVSVGASNNSAARRRIINVRTGVNANDAATVGQVILASGGSMSGTLYTQSIFPTTTNTYSVGSETLQYSTIYARDFYENGVPLSEKYGSGTITSQDIEDALGYLPANGNNYLPINGGSLTGDLSTFSVYPKIDNYYDIGSSIYRYKNVYTNNVTSSGVSSDTLTCSRIITISSSNSIIGIPGIPFENGYFTNLYKNGVEVATLDDIAAGSEPLFDAWVNGTSIIAGNSATSDSSTTGVTIGANATGTQEAISIGPYAYVNGRYGVAIGYNSSAVVSGTALGPFAQVVGQYGVSLGYGASVAIDPNRIDSGGVAIGLLSSVAESDYRASERIGPVSFGTSINPNNKRRLINVAAGINDTDVVNVKQMNDAIDAAGGGSYDGTGVETIKTTVIDASNNILNISSGSRLELDAPSLYLSGEGGQISLTEEVIDFTSNLLTWNGNQIATLNDIPSGGGYDGTGVETIITSNINASGNNSSKTIRMSNNTNTNLGEMYIQISTTGMQLRHESPDSNYGGDFLINGFNNITISSGNTALLTATDSISIITTNGNLTWNNKIVATVEDIPNTDNFVATTGNQTVGGQKTFSAQMNTSTIHPTTANAPDIGSTTKRYRGMYAVTGNFTNLLLNNVAFNPDNYLDLTTEQTITGKKIFEQLYASNIWGENTDNFDIILNEQPVVQISYDSDIDNYKVNFNIEDANSLTVNNVPLVTVNDIPSTDDFVTLDTAQTITGAKTFSWPVTVTNSVFPNYYTDMIGSLIQIHGTQGAGNAAQISFYDSTVTSSAVADIVGTTTGANLFSQLGRKWTYNNNEILTQANIDTSYFVVNSSATPGNELLISKGDDGPIKLFAPQIELQAHDGNIELAALGFVGMFGSRPKWTTDSYGTEDPTWNNLLIESDLSGYVKNGDNLGEVTIFTSGEPIWLRTTADEGLIVDSQSVVIRQSTLFTDNIVSNENSTYTLGTSTNRWEDIYGNNLHITDGLYLNGSTVVNYAPWLTRIYGNIDHVEETASTNIGSEGELNLSSGGVINMIAEDIYLLGDVFVNNSLVATASTLNGYIRNNVMNNDAIAIIPAGGKQVYIGSALQTSQSGGCLTLDIDYAEFGTKGGVYETGIIGYTVRLNPEAELIIGSNTSNPNVTINCTDFRIYSDGGEALLNGSQIATLAQLDAYVVNGSNIDSVNIFVPTGESVSIISGSSSDVSTSKIYVDTDGVILTSGVGNIALFTRNTFVATYNGREIATKPVVNFGNASTTGSSVQIPIDPDNIEDLFLKYEYVNATTGRLLFIAAGEVFTDVDCRRVSIYGDASEGQAWDGTTITDVGFSTGNAYVDDTVLSQSNDWIEIQLFVNNSWYECKAFVSGGGERVRLSWIKIS